MRPPDNFFIAGKNAIARGAYAATEPKEVLGMVKYLHVKVAPADEGEKQAAAENTARLRALRLAKEAADRETETGSGQAMPTTKKSRAPRDGKPPLRAS